MQRVNQFAKQFDEYTAAVNKVSKSFGELQNEIDSIATGGTRYKKLNVPVREIEKLRKNQGIPELEVGQAYIDDDAIE